MYHNPTRQQLERELEGRAAVWTREETGEYYAEHYDGLCAAAKRERERDPEFADEMENQALKYAFALADLYPERM
jgi:hypothetical protein